MSENPEPTRPADGRADQDADPPTDGIPGPVHPEEPAEGPDLGHEAGTEETSQID